MLVSVVVPRPQLSRTDGYSSLFARYFLGPRKLVFRKETFRSDPTPGRLGPVCKVPAVFSNGDSLYLWGEPKAITVAYGVLEVSWTTLTNRPKSGKPIFLKQILGEVLMSFLP